MTKNDKRSLKIEESNVAFGLGIPLEELKEIIDRDEDLAADLLAVAAEDNDDDA